MAIPRWLRQAKQRKQLRRRPFQIVAADKGVSKILDKGFGQS